MKRASVAGETRKNQKRVRYALVGAGNIAQVAVLPAFAHAKENSELVAIVSSDAVKRRALSRQYGVRWAGGYEEMEQVLRASEADAIYLSVPNELHRSFTERSAKVGAHVLCEKPMATTVRDCRAMNAAVKRYGVKLMIAYRLHFEEANLRAIEEVRSKTLGPVRYFGSLFSHQIKEGIRTRADLGGGALLDLGPYPINAARNLFGAEPTEVFALQVFGVDKRSREVDEMTTAVLRFPGDRLAQLTVSQGAAGVSNYRVVGTKGDLRVEPAFEYVEALDHHLTLDNKTRDTRFRKRDQFAPELIYFSNCILRDLNPEPSGEEGLLDVRVIEALMQSSRRDRPVSLPPMERSVRPSLRQHIYKPPVRKPSTVRAPAPSIH